MRYMTEKTAEITDTDKEYETTDQGFAAFLATRYMFLDAVDTGEKMGRGQYGNKKAFLFLIPQDVDVEQLRISYNLGTDETKVPFSVAVNKMRLMRQACRKPFNSAGVPQHG